MEELLNAISRQPRFLHNKSAPKSKCKTKMELWSENKEINEIAKKKNKYHKKKNKGGKKEIVKKQKTLWQIKLNKKKEQKTYKKWKNW